MIQCTGKIIDRSNSKKEIILKVKHNDVYILDFDNEIIKSQNTGLTFAGIDLEKRTPSANQSTFLFNKDLGVRVVAFTPLRFDRKGFNYLINLKTLEFYGQKIIPIEFRDVDKVFNEWWFDIKGRCKVK